MFTLFASTVWQAVYKAADKQCLEGALANGQALKSLAQLHDLVKVVYRHSLALLTHTLMWKKEGAGKKKQQLGAWSHKGSNKYLFSGIGRPSALLAWVWDHLMLLISIW